MPIGGHHLAGQRCRHLTPGGLRRTDVVEAGQHDHERRRERGVEPPRDQDGGRVADNAAAGRLAGPDGDPVGDHSARCSQSLGRMIGPPEPGAPDDDMQIRIALLERRSDRGRFAGGRTDAVHDAAGSLDQTGDELAASGDGLGSRKGHDSHVGLTDAELLDPGREREGGVERAHAVPGRPQHRSRGSISPGGAHALTRRDGGDDLGDAACHRQAVRRQDRVGAARHRLAGLDPGRRRGEKARRIGRGADHFVGRHRPAVPESDRTKRHGLRRHDRVGEDAADRLAQPDALRLRLPCPAAQARDRSVERHQAAAAQGTHRINAHRSGSTVMSDMEHRLTEPSQRAAELRA